MNGSSGVRHSQTVSSATPSATGGNRKGGNSIPLGPSGAASGAAGASAPRRPASELPAGGNGSSGGKSSSKAGFRTDTDISRSAQPNGKERELKKWVDDHPLEPPSAELASVLDFSAPSSSAKWDQFAVNKKKFGVKSTYNELYYTTAIDKSHPEYIERERRAEQLAREIEKSGHGGNVHVAEERGIVIDDSGLDEEDKYSGVQRTAIATDAAKAKSNPQYLENREKEDRALDAAKLKESIVSAVNEQRASANAGATPAAGSTTNSSSASPKPKRKFNFSAAAAKSGGFNPTPVFMPAPMSVPSPMGAPLSGPPPPMPSFTPGMPPHPMPFAPSSPSPQFPVGGIPPGMSSAVPSRPSPSPSVSPTPSSGPRALKDTDFDYAKRLKQSEDKLPNAFATHPTWTTGSEMSFRDILTANVPAVRVPMMPYSPYMPRPPMY